MTSNKDAPIPSVSMQYGQTKASTSSNELGMRAMQERAYAQRGEQYVLIKSPPASGKSRALMFIALDKLHHQGVKKAIIAVPEKSIGSSFANESLTKFGFDYDWVVAPQWNLCNAPGIDEPKVAASKAKAVAEFMESDDPVLVCTHATFRFAVRDFGIELFDDCLIAIDEFHHVSTGEDNQLGAHLRDVLARDKVHMVAMTGSYFRGDAQPVLLPEDEAKFATVTYTYYEQLNGYEFLKTLDIGYYFYNDDYTDTIMKVLDAGEKTSVHIPNVNSRESSKDKLREAENIMEQLGEWHGQDPETGFNLIKRDNGQILKVADLIDPEKQGKVSNALKDPAQKNNRDHVDIILALGMAKEGFDWIWCEHALTIGYRNSLTEIIQIIGRATRDAKDKTRARFTNLIAEPDASEEKVVDAVNDTLKAIAASLLMEQVLAPRFTFAPKSSGAVPDVDYGEGGYKDGQTNVGFNDKTGQFHVELNGLVTPQSPEAARIVKEDINEVITSFVQDKHAIERGFFDEETIPEELTQLRMGKIVKDKYPDLSENDQESVRQHAIVAMNLIQKGKETAENGDDIESRGGTALLDGIRKYAMDVRELDIDLIDRINPFAAAYAVLSKSLDENTLQQVAATIAAKKIKLTPDEARELALRALKFKKERGRLPLITSADLWERRMAEGVAFLQRMAMEAEKKQEEAES